MNLGTLHTGRATPPELSRARASVFAMLRRGKGFRTPSKDELRPAVTPKRLRREAVRQATCAVIRAEQAVERDTTPETIRALSKARSALNMARLAPLN